MILVYAFLQLAFSQVYFENLDEEIRFQEDPYYAEYIREKVKHIETEKKAQEEQRLLTKKYKEAVEQSRREQVQKRDQARLNQEAIEKKAFADHTARRELSKKHAEAERQSFIAVRDQEHDRIERTRSEQIAKMRQEVSRLPASYFQNTETPRVPKKLRKFP